MGIVEEVGAEVTQIKPGDRVVIPFNAYEIFQKKEDGAFKVLLKP